jgi:GalNAc-alpha-(1->4)-GalNAc-alpha-(1->3)-diNAcBac-PP-undecaprenol alpha-1,4-N-acetyl-D-galactosaminyltransferase
MHTHKRVTCIIHSLAGGGAEKIMTILAGGLVTRGYEVTLLTLTENIPDFYPAPEGVKRVSLLPEAYKECKRINIIGRLRRKNAFKKSILLTNPDIVISFMDLTNITIIATLADTNIPVLVSEHTDPRHYNIGWKWNIARWFWYSKAANVVMLTDETLQWARRQWPRWQASAIPNPVLPPDFSAQTERPSWFGKKNLIAMGRLVGIKGYDMLLRAFEMIADNFPDWNLTILGEGGLRPDLESFIKDTGLEKRVFLPGTFNPPHAILSQADILVMSSRFEGFPNAICEGMSCGLPVVSFDCPSGPRAIIRNGIDGVLVPPEDVNALASALGNLMSDDEQRRHLAKLAPEVLERFSLDLYLDRWENLISQVIGEG